MRAGTSITRTSGGAAADGAAAGGAGASDPVDERQVDRWVQDLRRVVVGGQVQVIAAVGEYLLEHVYGGVDEAASRHPKKAASLRRLAERAPEFGMRPAALVRAVPIALQVRKLGRGLGLRLGVSQHRALLPVQDPGEKKLLAEAAVAAGWSAEELRRKVRRVQRPHGGGRPPEPAVRLFLRKLDRVTAGTAEDELRESAAGLDPGEAKKLLAAVNAAQAQLERIEKHLTRAALRRRG